MSVSDARDLVMCCCLLPDDGSRTGPRYSADIAFIWADSRGSTWVKNVPHFFLMRKGIVRYGKKSKIQFDSKPHEEGKASKKPGERKTTDESTKRGSGCCINGITRGTGVKITISSSEYKRRRFKSLPLLPPHGCRQEWQQYDLCKNEETTGAFPLALLS